MRNESVCEVEQSILSLTALRRLNYIIFLLLYCTHRATAVMLHTDYSRVHDNQLTVSENVFFFNLLTGAIHRPAFKHKKISFKMQ